MKLLVRSCYKQKVCENILGQVFLKNINSSGNGFFVVAIGTKPSPGLPCEGKVAPAMLNFGIPADAERDKKKNYTTKILQPNKAAQPMVLFVSVCVLVLFVAKPPYVLLDAVFVCALCLSVWKRNQETIVQWPTLINSADRLERG